jgi:hypothetical protein
MTNKQRCFTQKLLPLLLTMYGGSALAFEQIKFDDGSVLDISTQVTYVNAKRLVGVDPGLLKVPIPPSTFVQFSPTLNGYVNQVANQALQQITNNMTRANTDDGDRSVGKHGTISNKVSALIDISLKKDDYRAFARISTFKDYVYDHPNDNNTPAYVPGQPSVNSNATFNGIGPSNQWTQEAKDLNGQRTRFLDAYLQGQWKLSDGSNGTSNPLTVKVGRQVVAWGEGLAFQGIGGSMNPQDAVKAQIPGTPLKEMFLPSEQVYVSLGATDKLTLMAYDKWKFRETEVMPSGTYFSPADMVGPGGSFMSGGDILGVYCLLYGGGTDPTKGDKANCPGGYAAGNIGAGREPDVGRKSTGQWGFGAKYQYTEATEFGAYFLHYNSMIGLPEFQYASTVAVTGYPYTVNGSAKVDLLNTLMPNFVTAPIQNLLPYSYHVRYMDDIKLLGGSFSTKLGEYGLAGEFAVRDGEPILMGAGMDKHYGLARGKVENIQVSAIRAWGGEFAGGLLGVSNAALAGEIAMSHLSSFETPAYSGFPTGTQMLPQFACSAGQGCFINYPGGIPLVDKINGLAFKQQPPQPSGVATSTAYMFDLMMDYTAIFPGWDLENEVQWFHQLQGNPAMQNGWNSGLQGRNDRRLSLGMKFTYQSNLELGLKLVYFLGNADNTSFVNMRTMVDRDLISFTATYHF